MASQRNDYFVMFSALIDYSCQAAGELQRLMKSFDDKTVEKRLDEIHAIEHAADEKMHFVKEKLAKEFITPIEREDILAIAGRIDDITDAIEDVVLNMYMYHVRSIRKEAFDFCDIIVECCEGLRTIFAEFHNFKKSKNLRKPIIEVNRLEEVGDRLYVKSMRRLFDENTSPVEIMVWSQMFGQLEQCCDICEDTADCVEEIIMKNS